MKPVFLKTGTCSTFGGFHDLGMTPDEGLALLEWRDAVNPLYAHLFVQPVVKALGLGRQLNPAMLYCAMRWNYSEVSRDELVGGASVLVSFKGKHAICFPVDWGPNIRTGRLIDLSPGAAELIGAKTGDEVTVELYVR